MAGRADCLLGVLFGDHGLKPATQVSVPDQNSAATALRTGRGSCAALVGVVLALTEDLGAPFEAVVLRDHVLLALRGSADTFYEVVDGGRAVTNSVLSRYEPLPPGGPVRVGGRAYLPYYLDNLAARYAEAEDAETAEKLFKTALELGPTAPRVHYNFGTFLLQRKRYDEALGHLQRAIRLGWKDADAYVNRGVALQELGRKGKAAQSFRQALDLDPQDRRATTNLRQLEGTARSERPR